MNQAEFEIIHDQISTINRIRRVKLPKTLTIYFVRLSFKVLSDSRNLLLEPGLAKFSLLL